MKQIKPHVYRESTPEHLIKDGWRLIFVQFDQPSLEYAAYKISIIPAYSIVKAHTDIRFEYIGSRKELLACGCAKSYMFEVGKSGTRSTGDSEGIHYSIKRYAHDRWRIIYSTGKEFSNPHEQKKFEDFDLKNIIDKYASGMVPMKRNNVAFLEIKKCGNVSHELSNMPVSNVVKFPLRKNDGKAILLCDALLACIDNYHGLFEQFCNFPEEIKGQDEDGNQHPLLEENIQKTLDIVERCKQHIRALLECVGRDIMIRMLIDRGVASSDANRITPHSPSGAEYLTFHCLNIDRHKIEDYREETHY